MNKSAEEILKEAWIGKTLVSREFDDECLSVGFKITDVDFVCDEDRDPKIFLTLEEEDVENLEIYPNEKLEVK